MQRSLPSVETASETRDLTEEVVGIMLQILPLFPNLVKEGDGWYSMTASLNVKRDCDGVIIASQPNISLKEIDHDPA